MSIEIKKTTRVHTDVKWHIRFKFDHKIWEIAVWVRDGKVVGDHTNIGTSDLPYYEYPDEILKENFVIIKKHIESLN